MRTISLARSLRYAILFFAIATGQSILRLEASAQTQPKVTVTITPANEFIQAGADRQFQARVKNGAKGTVTWSLVPPAGVNPALIGRIDATTGKYFAPAAPLPGFAALIVQAKSNDDPNVIARLNLTVRNRNPVLTRVTPGEIPFGATFKLDMVGRNFLNGAKVYWNDTPINTVFVSATQLTATGTPPTSGRVNLKVTNPGPESVSEAITINVISGVKVSISPTIATLATGGTQAFTATVTGTTNSAVSWLVNGIAGGNSSIGTVTATGVYTAPKTLPTAGMVTVSARSQADNTTTATASVTIQDVTVARNARFLDQVTFGPTPGLIARVREIGIDAFLEEQFNAPESAWPALSTNQRSALIDAFFANALLGQDQLRQRVIFALSEILVISMNKNTNSNEIIPWLQLLSRNAFGNYRTMLKELTIDASMGKFLDLANSGVGSGAPNENYPREVMQLFSIGLAQLNQDGSIKKDANGNAIPTYTQTDVVELAKALTGWTYNNATGTTRSYGNYNYYPGPMIPVPGKHVTTAKTILGQGLPAGQTAQQDLEGAIDILFNHPNVGPFIATRLIRALVTSNPSPEYISRVAGVFNNNGQGVRGDMKAVIRAIILDEEARNDTPAATFGRLRTPVQHTTAVCRALAINPGKATQFAYLFYDMNEGMLDAPSVFGHYSPMYRIPKSNGLYGPEFQIYSPSDAVNRANFLYYLMADPWPIDPALAPLIAIAGNPTALVNAVDNLLLYGRMSASTRASITTALASMPDNNARVLTAVYLTVTSGEHLVQR